MNQGPRVAANFYEKLAPARACCLRDAESPADHAALSVRITHPAMHHRHAEETLSAEPAPCRRQYCAAVSDATQGRGPERVSRPLTSQALDATHEQLVQLLQLRRDGEVDELVANLWAAAVSEHCML